MDTKNIYTPPKFILLLQFSILITLVVGAWRTNWLLVFMSLMTVCLMSAVAYFGQNFKFRIPSIFLTLITIFIYATLFLGEVGGFYEWFWWWDVVLHAGSALVFGLIGMTTLIVLFERENISAPPIIIAVFAFTFAVAIGAVWEIFEYMMDAFFGTSMQKSGLVDTMWDLTVDSVGALMASFSGYLYLTENKETGVSGLVAEAVADNKH